MVRKADNAAEKPGNTLQTLDRGLQALSVIAGQPEGISVAALAARLEVHRAIAYRLATTLEMHGLIARDAAGALHLGAGILTLASRFGPQLRARAQPLLQELAGRSGAAAFLSVAQGEECVAVAVAEPEGRLLHIAYRVGNRHPLSRGAAGIAILAGRPEGAGDTDAVREARRSGVSITRSELQRGAVGVASPIPGLPGFEASLGVVALDDLDVDRASAWVTDCARRLGQAVAG
ncbi:IclR family transcriptional regulator [Roseomonas populi]|uniref:Helix-turn-helix domain-containing protein n=1 Tax=Roseomonas populi TaxID=3121582 RepID=A0ABT1X1K5_9PROT|nr:helix-turn-helix domain-containing protein [Roseomonas pecuniae]MCR0981981.1 helix-turn-helix domain-containing protein [Roseomonas pecuniae]